jgi:hypothetical protein
MNSSSFGPGAHSQLPGQGSKDSRGSSSNKSRKKPAGAKWKDPWLAPAPKSPRTVSVAVKLDRPASTKPPGDDNHSDSSAVPLRVIYSHADDGAKPVHDEL